MPNEAPPMPEVTLDPATVELALKNALAVVVTVADWDTFGPHGHLVQAARRAQDGLRALLAGPAPVSTPVVPRLDPATVEACARAVDALPVEGIATLPYSKALKVAAATIRSLAATPLTPVPTLACAKCGAERHGVTPETFVCRRCLSMDSSGVVNPYEKPPRPLEPSEDAPPTPVPGPGSGK